MANQISPMAFVHPDAKLGDGNIIGPFCYVDADVVIGDNNVLQNSVTLNQGTRMGSNNEIFPKGIYNDKIDADKRLCEIKSINNETNLIEEIIKLGKFYFMGSVS